MYLVDFALFFSERKNMNKKKRIAILFAVILVNLLTVLKKALKKFLEKM